MIAPKGRAPRHRDAAEGVPTGQPAAAMAPAVTAPGESVVREAWGMQVGELARRTGVSAHTLRVWERRYGLLQPARSYGGYRLYGPDDERRVRAVVQLREQGVTASEAARRVLGADRTTMGHRPETTTDPAGATTSGTGPAGDDRCASESDFDLADALIVRLHRAIDRLDESAASDAIDEGMRRLPFHQFCSMVLVPYLDQLGTRWAEGKTSIAHEHFATALVRRRMSALSQTWGRGAGPIVALACPPGEQHDVMLLAFGVLLGQAGWRVLYLGQDTPVADVRQACAALAPDAVVFATRSENCLVAAATELAELAASRRVVLAGRGATNDVAQRLDVALLPHDLSAAAAELGRLVRADRQARTNPGTPAEPSHP